MLHTMAFCTVVHKAGHCNKAACICHRITRAPKGAAAFDVISEQQYHGVVLDRMVKSKNNISSGLLHYEDNGIPAKLIFGPKDLSVSAASTPYTHLCSKAYVHDNCDALLPGRSTPFPEVFLSSLSRLLARH